MASPSPRSARLRRTALFVPLLTACSLALSPVRAQPSEAPYNRVRALNLARATAVQLNGGLSAYHPAACMFATSEAENPCLLRRDGQGFLFRFLGGVPGWEVQKDPASRETELLIAPDGRSVLQVLYNGAPR